MSLGSFRFFPFTSFAGFPANSLLWAVRRPSGRIYDKEGSFLATIVAYGWYAIVWRHLKLRSLFNSERREESKCIPCTPKHCIHSRQRSLAQGCAETSFRVIASGQVEPRKGPIEMDCVEAFDGPKETSTSFLIWFIVLHFCHSIHCLAQK